jgi:hypothetical protein
MCLQREFLKLEDANFLQTGNGEENMANTPVPSVTFVALGLVESCIAAT